MIWGSRSLKFEFCMEVQWHYPGRSTLESGAVWGSPFLFLYIDFTFFSFPNLKFKHHLVPRKSENIRTLWPGKGMFSCCVLTLCIYYNVIYLVIMYIHIWGPTFCYLPQERPFDHTRRNNVNGGRRRTTDNDDGRRRTTTDDDGRRTAATDDDDGRRTMDDDGRRRISFL